MAAEDKLDQKRKKRRIKRRAVRFLCWLSVAAVSLAVFLFITLQIMVFSGGRSLKAKSGGAVPDLGLSAQGVLEDGIDNMEDSVPGRAKNPEGSGSVVWKADWVQYKDKIYDFNENIMTFLVMGIDINAEVEETEGADGGQADALFLVVVNPDKETIDLIAVNRDTMTDVYLYGYEDTQGEIPVVTAQIATQHGFGDGMELSCQYTCEAVSALFYNLPINGYAALNMAGIPVLNDALGGVDVEVLEDLTKIRKNWTKGTKVHLEGQDSFYYVKWRDITIFESALGRLERQKQYMKAFADRAIEAVKEDITFPVRLFDQLKKYMVTDLTADEIAYMAGNWIQYDFGRILSMKGETLHGMKHEEFYPDYDALRELVLDVFYEEVTL